MAPHHRAKLSLSPLLLLVLPSSVHSARSQEKEHDFFAIVDDAVFLPTNGLSPPPPPGSQQRYYLPAIPAYPALGSLEKQQQWRQRQGRQRDVQPIDCGDGKHNCLDAGPDGAEMCCPDTRYCFAGSDLNVHCCAVGNVCSDDTPCPSGFNYCISSQTVTTTVTRSASNSNGGSSATTETLEEYPTGGACCNRPCATEEFLCGPAFGGQCCPLGLRCATSGQCISDVTSTPPPVANPIPSGCSFTWQFSCDAAAGHGCCASGQTCRSPSFCDGETAFPTVTGANGETFEPVDDSGGISSGAKAGVGIGVAVVVLGVGTALVAFCLRRRRKRNAGASTGGRQASATLLSDGPDGANHNRHHGMNNVGGGGGGGSSSRIRDIFHMGPLSPVAHRERRGTMVDSEMSGPTSAGGTYYGNASSGGGGVPGSNGGGGAGGRRPQPHRTGLTQDYFGPEAVPGPYTEGPDTSPVAPPKRHGGVGAHPEGPNDIMTPVEIGSSRLDADASDRMGMMVGGGGHRPHQYAEGSYHPHRDGNDEAAGGAGGGGMAAYGLVELPGSPPLPSPSPPMSSGDADEPRRTLSPSP